MIYDGLFILAKWIKDRQFNTPVACLNVEFFHLVFNLKLKLPTR